MTEIPYWYLGDRNPSITETVTIDGVAQDLTASTARKFKMRAVGESTLKVNANATAVTPPGVDGELRYDWAAADVDTAGTYLVWWEITISSKVQAVGEALIQIRAHTDSGNYIELEEFKASANLSAVTFADVDITRAIGSASAAVEAYKDTRFYPTPNETRYYTADASASCLRVHDLTDVGTLTVDTDGNGSYDTAWTEGTDYVLSPANAVTDGYPYNEIELLTAAGRTFPRHQRAVKIVGTFGWATTPIQVEQAVIILANRYLKRTRETPYGIVQVGVEAVAAARLGRIDPDVATLLELIRGATTPGLRSVPLG